MESSQALQLPAIGCAKNEEQPGLEMLDYPNETEKIRHALVRCTEEAKTALWAFVLFHAYGGLTLANKGDADLLIGDSIELPLLSVGISLMWFLVALPSLSLALLLYVQLLLRHLRILKNQLCIVTRDHPQLRKAFLDPPWIDSLVAGVRGGRVLHTAVANFSWIPCPILIYFCFQKLVPVVASNYPSMPRFLCHAPNWAVFGLEIVIAAATAMIILGKPRLSVRYKMIAALGAVVLSLVSLLVEAYRPLDFRERILADDGDSKPPVDLSGKNLINLQAIRAKLPGTLASRAVLDCAQLDYANLKGATLSGASMKYASLISADLDSAALYKANLQHAILNSASMNSAQLGDAELNYAWLQGAKLSGASLQSADLSSAVLVDAELVGAAVKDAIFHNTDVLGADLTGVDLSKEQFRGLCISDGDDRHRAKTRLPAGWSTDELSSCDNAAAESWFLSDHKCDRLSTTRSST